MRIATIGDPHITSGPRFARTVGVLDWCVDAIAGTQPELIAIMGDDTGTHDVPHVATVQERGVNERLHVRCAEIAPTISLRGNHDDPEDFAQLANLRHPNLYVIHGAKPELVDINRARIVCVPYPHRRDYQAAAERSASVRADYDAASGVLRASVGRLAEDARQMATPQARVLLLAHCNVRGALTAGDCSWHRISLRSHMRDRCLRRARRRRRRCF